MREDGTPTHTHTHTRTHTHTYAHTHIRTYTYTHKHIRTHTHAHTYTHATTRHHQLTSTSLRFHVLHHRGKPSYVHNISLAELLCSTIFDIMFPIVLLPLIKQVFSPDLDVQTSEGRTSVQMTLTSALSEHEGNDKTVIHHIIEEARFP